MGGKPVRRSSGARSPGASNEGRKPVRGSSPLGASSEGGKPPRRRAVPSSSSSAKRPAGTPPFSRPPRRDISATAAPTAASVTPGAMRLNRFLASAGLGSRRACEEIIAAGRVSINGHTCETLATTVNPGDGVKVDGRPVQAQRLVYLMLNKPAGFLSTRTDPGQRDTVFDLLPPELPRLFHVGRLDQDSEGLLILTNDGDLSLRLTHPRYKVDKEYEVTLDRNFDMELAPHLLEGVFIPVEGEGFAPGQRIRARAAGIYRLGAQKLKVVLRQGLKRQVRLMFAELGYEVRKLLRTRQGSLMLGRVRSGEWRYLTPQEVALLKAGEAAPQKKPGRA
jgi:23S rRNA pseudouridine2605 synthase